jgi:hypothetical protein
LDDRSACKDNITNLSRSRWLVMMARDSNVVIKGLVLDVRRTEQAPCQCQLKRCFDRAIAALGTMGHASSCLRDNRLQP